MMRRKMGGVLSEPLFHFLLIGAALFLVFGWGGTPASIPGGVGGTTPTQIIVPREGIELMTAQFEKTWQRKPTEEETKNLIQDYIRNEIFYREALAIGLDRDDEVLKRHLRQKMEFIYEDIASLREPSDDELGAFLRTHPDRYAADPKVAFRQVFISTDKRGRGAEDYARQLLARIASGVNPDSIGDPSLLEPDVPLSPLSTISQQFGEDFGKSLLLPVAGRWAGPLRSTFGLHLIFVRERVVSRLPDLNDVRELVRRDWTIEQQKSVKDAAYEKIRDRYTVTVDMPQAPADSMSPRLRGANQE